MNKEYEQVSHKKFSHLNILLNNIKIRNLHFHNEIELLCVFRGKCKVSLLGETILAECGDVILINHNTVHDVYSKEGADFVIIQFSVQSFKEYFKLLQTTKFEKLKITDGLGKEKRAILWGLIYDLAINYLSLKDSTISPIKIITSLSSLISFLYENCPYSICSQTGYANKRKAEQRIQRVVDCIKRDYNSKVLLHNIAKAEGLTPTHLSHFFHEQMGISFRDYLNNIRFENALRLLSNKNMSALDVALSCGFSDVKYMTKTFKLRTGKTPGQYRKQNVLEDETIYLLNELVYNETDSLTLLNTHVRPLLTP